MHFNRAMSAAVRVAGESSGFMAIAASFASTSSSSASSRVRISSASSSVVRFHVARHAFTSRHTVFCAMPSSLAIWYVDFRCM